MNTPTSYKQTKSQLAMKSIISILLVLFSLNLVAQENGKEWTLQECVVYAIENNINVKQSELSTLLKEAEITRAKMDFYPTVNGNVGTSFNFDNPQVNHSFSNNLGISSNAVLYNGNRNKNNVKLTEKDVEISKLNTLQTRDNITLSILNAYLNILYSKENIIIAAEQISVGENSVQRMQELVDAGVKAKNELFQVEANLSANQESLVKAENNLDLALLELAQILQIPHQDFRVAPVNITVDTAILNYKNSDLIYNTAVGSRPEIASAQLNIENADISIDMAKSGKLPIVSASYSFGTNFYYDLQTDFEQAGYFKQLENNRGHSVGVSMSIPIFDKNVTKINTQRAQIQKEMANFTLENEKINLRASIERAYIDAKTSLKTYEAAQKSVSAQKEAFRTAQERYNAGVLTSFDFDQVRNQLVNAQSALVRAKYNYVFRTKYLDFYAGKSIEM